jgi:glucosamine-phosphate N-acetyltransferase
MNKKYIIRELEENDFEKYMILMFEFTNYEYKITKETFCEKLNSMKKNNYNKIIILYSSDNNELMGCGTIIKLEKLHNNPIGQIEDVIVSEKYRGLGLGKLIIESLVNIGLNEFKCYKIILNCLEKNIGFYKKSGFEIAGVEMKYSMLNI